MWRQSRCIPVSIKEPAGLTIWRPAADVYRTSTGWLVKFELAGVRPEDIELEVRGRCLSIHGRRQDWVIEKGCHYYALEISYSAFERRIEFPVEFDKYRVSTEYHAGMLLVRIEQEGEGP
jgi:HSP20 family protein